MAISAPVLVVGAGTTGLTMASELARHGAPVRIIDKLAAINPHCRATAVHARTLEIFHDFGIADEIVSSGVRIVGMSQYSGGKRFAHSSAAELDSPYPFSISIEQSKTEAALERMLNSHGIRVERETELLALAQSADEVEATVRRADGGDEVIGAPFLIGCDGAHSRVRHLNRMHFPGEEDPRQYLVADVKMEAGLARDELHFFLTDRGILLLFPLPDNRWLVVNDLPTHHDPAREHPTLAELGSLLAERGPSGARIADPRWLSYFRINYRSARHYRHGRIFLAGDAVHVHSPMGGLGMNTGIQDAYNLAWKLALVARGRSRPGLLDSYEKERRPVAEDVVRITRMMTERFEAFAGLAPEQRERLYFNLVIPPEAAQQIARHSEELDLSYAKSPICREHWNGAGASTGPHAGEQAPDARPLVVNGAAASLYDLLRGPAHTLLLFPASAPESWRRMAAAAAIAGELSHGSIKVWVAAADPANVPAEFRPRAIGDPKGELFRRYGAGAECMYLVRPDGYVGLRAAPAEPARLREYLGRVFERSFRRVLAASKDAG